MNHRRFKVFLSVAFLLYCPQAISQDLNPSILFHKAKSQIQRQTLEQRIYVHRSVAVPFADSIKTLADSEDPITTIPAYTGPGPLFNFSSHPDSTERARRLDKLLR